MRTSAQALRAAMESGAVASWYRGENVQSAVAGMNPHWLTYKEHDGSSPDFSNPQLVWRRKPCRPRAPFNQTTVPKHALWRVSGGGGPFYTVNAYGLDGLVLYSHEMVTWSNLSESFEYSIDGGVTWGPANQEVAP